MNKPPTMTSEELRAARSEMGLTQTEAAEKFGVSLSGYKKWELGVATIPGPAVLLVKYLLLDARKLQKQ
jgi:DNA-binding transcriptional regulator YiaG